MEPPNLTATELLAKWQHVLDRSFDVFSWTSIGELSWLAHMASQASEICEIGCYHGKSTRVMAMANPTARIMAIDRPQDERCWRILELNTDDMRVLLRKGTSSEILPITYPDRKFDLGFIDAGHLAEDVSGDIANLLPRMAPGGVISGHDWRHNDMNDGVNRGVLAHFRLEELRFWESIWFVKLP